MKKLFLYPIIAIAIFSITASAQWTNAQLQGVIVTNTNEQTVVSSLALDNSGTLHLLFKRFSTATTPTYHYTYKPLGGAWAPEIPIGTPTAGITSPYLTVDKANGMVFIIYLQGGLLKMAWGAGGNLVVSTFTIPDVTAMYSPAVTVDNLGRVHCALVAQIPTGEYYIGYGFYFPMSGTYSYQLITNSQLGAFGSGAAPSITALANGAVVIAYRGGGFGDYQIQTAENAVFGGNAWTVRTIATPGYQCYSTSLRTTPDNRVHLAYSGDLGWGMPGSIFYTHRDAPYTWAPYIMVSSNFSVVNPKLVMESDGTGHIVCEGRSGNILTGDIYYTGNSTGTWIAQLLQGGDKYEPSLVVDPQGNCSMVFYQYVTTANNDVYYYGYVAGGPAPELIVTLVPLNPPIQIPATGGNFIYDLNITNAGNTTASFDFWVDAVLPNGNNFGPIIQRNNLTLNSGATIIRNDLTQAVPGTAPAGNYLYIAKTGDYPATIFAGDTIAFTKLGAVDSRFDNWGLSGWDGSDFIPYPLSFILSASPNPFNSSLALRFEMPDASPYELIIYDITGREVWRLATRNSQLGTNEVVWDAEGLPSGIYFVRLTANSQQLSANSVQKVMLLR